LNVGPGVDLSPATYIFLGQLHHKSLPEIEED
jgi:hypothetical protein